MGLKEKKAIYCIYRIFILTIITHIESTKGKFKKNEKLQFMYCTGVLHFKQILKGAY